MNQMKFESLFDFPTDVSATVGDGASTAAGASIVFPITPQDGALELSDLSSAFEDHSSFPSDPSQLVTPLTDTISPQDLLGSVDLLDTPIIDAPLDNPDNWASLFGPAPPLEEKPFIKEESPSSPVDDVVHLGSVVKPKRGKSNSAALAKLSSEALSAVGKRKFTEISSDIDAKKDDLGLTIYNRKPRSMPLSPIVMEEGGEGVTAKRARNTEAARRSRARKMERMIQLEELVSDLAEKNASLISQLESYREKFGEL